MKEFFKNFSEKTFVNGGMNFMTPQVAFLFSRRRRVNRKRQTTVSNQ